MTTAFDRFYDNQTPEHAILLAIADHQAHAKTNGDDFTHQLHKALDRVIAHDKLVADRAKLIETVRCMIEWDGMMRERFGGKYPLDMRPAPNVRTVDARALLRELRGERAAENLVIGECPECWQINWHAANCSRSFGS